MPANHGPFCESYSYHLGPCWYCGSPIWIHGCNDGSKVIFDDGTLERHYCVGYRNRNAREISYNLDADRSLDD